MPDEHLLKRLIATSQPAGLGPTRRAGTEEQSKLDCDLARLFKESALSGENQELMRALVLLWHDHLDAAHHIAQNIENPDGAFVHGIMHRREPDYSNAAYWFRRVGRHAVFPDIAKGVAALLETTPDGGPLGGLVHKGEWEPFAFINACEQATSGALPAEQIRLLERAQQVEFESLFRHFSA